MPTNPPGPADFYDRLAPFYHLIYPDWNASIERQGEQIGALIEAHWPGRQKLLDVSCGIGTQAIALALRGYRVTGSDLSVPAVERARREAAARGLAIDWSVCDMRRAHAHHGTGFEVVVSCDNSLPHLLTDADLLLALREMRACLAAGGGCLITVRDYEREERGRNLVKPYGVRIENGTRTLLFQVWDFDGDQYDVSFFFVAEDLASGAVSTPRGVDRQALRADGRGRVRAGPAHRRRVLPAGAGRHAGGLKAAPAPPSEKVSPQS